MMVSQYPFANHLKAGVLITIDRRGLCDYFPSPRDGSGDGEWTAPSLFRHYTRGSRGVLE